MVLDAGRPDRNVHQRIPLWGGLELVGLDFAVLFAVFWRSCPDPIFGTPWVRPTVAYGLSQSPGTASVVLAVYVGVHVIESYVTMPLVMAGPC